MKLHQLITTIALAITAITGNAWAATAAVAPANPQLAADTKAALARYDSDKKLCNDETSSSARLQCRRDAKEEYDQAIAAAKARTTVVAPVAAAPAAIPAPVASSTPPGTAAETACAECGRVMAVAVTQKAGDYSAVGVLAGGAIGAVLGNQVGGGFGKDLATLAGAAGGAYAGKVIEEKMKTHTVWTVTVHYANESKASFDFLADPGLQVGDRVKNSGSTIVRQ
jgi:outer membrane lipoprotein SlyB